MKKLCFLFLALPLFANDAQEASNPTTALDNGWFYFVSLTPTNLTLKCTDRGGGVFIKGADIKEYMLEHYDKIKLEYHDTWILQDDMEFTIPLDKEISFVDRHVEMIYTPILLANQQKGYRITECWYDLREGFVSTNWHVALRDPPVWVDEEDVEMILKNGEWIPYVKPERAAPSPVEHDASNAPELTRGEPSVVPDNENALPPPSRSARRTWLWWLALPAVAGVWLMARRARKKS